MIKAPSFLPPASLVAIVLLTANASVQAAPIELVPGTINMFRDTRGANNVDIVPGDRYQFGADIVGGSGSTTLGATYGPSGFVAGQGACGPLIIAPSICSRSTAFNAGRLAEPWLFRFERPGEAALSVPGPSLAGTESAVPFPVDVSITGSGTTPTLSWTIPGNFSPDAVRINVWDRSLTRAGNLVGDLVHSFAVPSSLTSYQMPSLLNSGRQLALGGDYVFNIQLIDTRGDAAAFVSSNNNAHILRRSSSFFNFTPLGDGGPPNVYLPTVQDGVYNFSITEVGPNSVTFIDPLVAVGYDYAIGSGDPAFASVLLPTGIGDDRFDLFLWDGDGFVDSGVDLEGGEQYFFGGTGVERFSIRGIETSAGLDPDNVGAFITGLTFVRDGAFHGTMTPLTVEVAGVPEPGSLALLLLGLPALRRRAWLPHRGPARIRASYPPLAPAS